VKRGVQGSAREASCGTTLPTIAAASGMRSLQGADRNLASRAPPDPPYAVGELLPTEQVITEWLVTSIGRPNSASGATGA